MGKKKRKRKRDPNRPRTIISAAVPRRIHLGLGVYIQPHRVAALVESLRAHPEWEDDPMWEDVDD